MVIEHKPARLRYVIVQTRSEEHKAPYRIFPLNLTSRTSKVRYTFGQMSAANMEKIDLSKHAAPAGLYGVRGDTVND